MWVVWSRSGPDGVATSADSIRSGQHTATLVGEGASGNRAAINNPQRRGPFASHDGATANESIAWARPMEDNSRCNGSTILRLIS